MLQLPETNLDHKWQNYLNTWQQEINAIASYAEQVQQAKKKYENKIKTATFKNIRGTLETMCSGVSVTNLSRWVKDKKSPLTA